MTYLCAALFVNDPVQTQRDIVLAAEAGADMVELRIDPFATRDLLDCGAIGELVRGSALPCIVTCRPTWEGGRSDVSNEDRVTILKAAREAGARYLDIEFEMLHQLPSTLEQLSPPIIVSYHNFQGRPTKMEALVLEMNHLAGDVNKIVWAPRSIRDNLEAFELLQHRHKPTIALCMGEQGVLTRLLARKFGAFLTFAALNPASATAPGQIAVSDLKHVYRWDSVEPSTRVYGVVGSPIAHSLSPAIHNAAFEEAGLDAVYVPLLVNPGYESFKAFMESFLNFPGMDLSGISVTIPHKENALRYLKEKGSQVDPLADAIGAVNTIGVDRSDGGLRLRGTSTDYAAILDSITARLGITRTELKNYRVAVLGAGGTGRTAVAALAQYGATVVVCNRTRERADALAAEFGGKSGKVVAASLEDVSRSGCQIIINATSVGMSPNIGQSPLDGQALPLTSETLVFDTVYNPLQTKLLKDAAVAGAMTIAGLEMFVRQAAAQFEMWTGTRAPVDVMQRVVEERLSPPAL